MYPQDSTLQLSTKLGYGNKTIIDKLFFTPPFKIIEPFYESNGVANIILMVASAGLMAGDKQEISLVVGENTKLHFTSQSFEKIHDTKDKYASRNMTICVENGAFLDFNPLPCILFPNSAFYGTSEVHLKQDSKLYFSEVLATKSVGAKDFLFKNYSFKLKIFIENKLCFYDNMNLSPQQNALNTPCILSEFSHYLNLIIIDSNFDSTKALKILESQPILSSITAINGGYCLKALGNNSESLLKLRENVCRCN